VVVATAPAISGLATQPSLASIAATPPLLYKTGPQGQTSQPQLTLMFLLEFSGAPVCRIFFKIRAFTTLPILLKVILRLQLLAPAQ
jgi:hypothetical protein